MEAVLKAILERRSIRRYTGEPVGRDVLTELVRAGMAAPTSRDTRHFCFVAVDDAALIQKMAEELPYAKMLLTARHAIVVASDMNIAHGGNSTDYWVQDCAAAAQNVLLAAQALGLGACWTAAHPRPERVSSVRAILGLSENINPLCVIAVGHPAGGDKPRDKFDPAKLFFNAAGKH